MPLFHRGSEKLQGESLLLRPFTIEDAEAMYTNWANDPEVTRYLTWRPHDSVESTKQLLEIWVRDYEDPARYHWGIVYLPEQKLIGSISLHDVREISERGEVGYCIGKAYWSKGLMTEALKLVLEFCFARVGFQRIQALHHIGNPASGKVMQKAGMQYEGTLRRYTVDNTGQFTDHCIWAALREPVQKN